MICPLDGKIISHLRSGVAINSLTQCVEELVLNSVDAGASCISVCVDLSGFRVQIVDNGSGISITDLEQVAQRHSTSKCHTLSDLRKLNSYGYRGEALASLAEISGVLEIVTRHRSSYKTLCSTFINGKFIGISERSISRTNVGTTITIHDLFRTLPVRRKVISEVLEFERIRQRLAAIALIHPEISFSLQNDDSKVKSLQTHRSHSLRSTFTQLFGSLKSKGLREVRHEVKQFRTEGFISIDAHHNKNLQFIYINSRLVLKTKIHKLVGNILTKSAIVKKLALCCNSDSIRKNTTESPDKQSDKYGIFALNITCPLDEYDITLEPAKTLVEFQDWDGLLKCVEECVQSFLLKENLVLKSSESESADDDSQNSVLLSSNTACIPEESHAINHSDKGTSLPAITDPSGINTSCIRKSLHSLVVCRKNKLILNGISNMENEGIQKRINQRECSEDRHVNKSSLELLSSKIDKPDDQPNETPKIDGECQLKKTSHSDNHKSNNATNIDKNNVKTIKHVSSDDSLVPSTREKEKLSDLILTIQKKDESKKGNKSQRERTIFPEHQVKNADNLDQWPHQTWSGSKRIEKEGLLTLERSNTVQPAAASTDFREKLKRLKYNTKADVLQTSSIQEKCSAPQGLRTRNLSVNKDRLKHRSGIFDTPNPITLQSLQSRKRYSNATETVDQTDNSSISLRVKKKILLSKERTSSHSGVSKLRGQVYPRESVFEGVKNSNRSRKIDAFQQTTSCITSNTPVHKTRNLITHTCSNRAIDENSTRISFSSSLNRYFDPSGTSSSAKKECVNENALSCNSNTMLSSSKFFDASFNSSEDFIGRVSIPSSSLQGNSSSMSKETTFLERGDDSSSVTLSEISSKMEGSDWNSSCIGKNENYSLDDSMKSSVDTQNADCLSNQSEESISETQDQRKVVENSISSDTNCENEQKNDAIPSEDEKEEWLHTYDSNCGKKIFVNLRSGNCSFELPLRNERKGENNAHEEKQQRSHPLLPHLSFNCSPWLPRADRITNKEVRDDLHTDCHMRLSPEVCEEQLMDNGTGEVSILKDSHPLCESQTVSNMVENWENPIFEGPEKGILNLNKVRYGKSEVQVHNVIFPYRFTKEMLNEMQVIKQVDKKFIACLLKAEETSRSCEREEDGLLVLVDQHAAHERVRLEQLQADLYEENSSSIKSSAISPAMEIVFTLNEARLITNYRAEFGSIGVQFENNKDLNTHPERETVAVRFVGLPSVFVERELSEVRRGRPSVAKSIVKGLIKEHLEHLSSTGGFSATIPKTILRVLNSQACHGAVKFGEPLTVTDCENLMESLAKCNLPFQCAHGRPSIIPLVDLKLIENKYKHELDNQPKATKLRDWARNQRFEKKETGDEPA